MSHPDDHQMTGRSTDVFRVMFNQENAIRRKHESMKEMFALLQEARDALDNYDVRDAHVLITRIDLAINKYGAPTNEQPQET